MSLSQLNRMTAITLAREIAQHRVSPVEALDAALARIGETELQLNAFVQIDAEGARGSPWRRERHHVGKAPRAAARRARVYQGPDRRRGAESNLWLSDAQGQYCPSRCTCRRQVQGCRCHYHRQDHDLGVRLSRLYAEPSARRYQEPLAQAMRSRSCSSFMLRCNSQR